MILYLNEKKSEDFERALNVFIEAAGKISANMLGMVNRVGGQIYALLFLSHEPLSLDEISFLLKISKSNIRIINKCKVQFDDLKKSSKEKSDQVDFIVNQLDLLSAFYMAASTMFEDFYQGR